MPAMTREEGLQDSIDILVDDLGATGFSILFAPAPNKSDPYLVSFEAMDAQGLAALYVAQIETGGRYVDGVLEYTSEVETGPVLLSENAIPGTLEQIEQGAEIALNGVTYVADLGYEERYPFQFETADGLEQVVLMINGAFRPTYTGPKAFGDRDIVLAEYAETDPQGSNQGDVVELAEGTNFNGFKGDDTILFGHDATVYGGSGEDIIQALGVSDDVLYGNQNDDRIYSGRGDDTVDGGTGDDYIIMTGTGVGMGGKGNDYIDARYSNGVDLYGGQGEDLLLGSAASETLVGGDGADKIYAGYDDGPADQANITPGDMIFGGKGNDSIIGGWGNDTINGGNGKDVINGSTGRDVIKGGGSNDELDGSVGEDMLFGGDGNDILQGGKDADTLYGGNGNDTLMTEEDTGGRTNEAGDVAYGGAGNDDLFGGRTADALFGGKGRDTLIGEGGDDTLDGGSGDDVLQGDIGNDVLNGGDGEDTVFGGFGDDVLRGGHDDDLLTGGKGSDTFGFGNDGSTDVVTDFEVGDDRIELIGFNNNLGFDDLFLSQDDSTAVIQAGDVIIRLENTDVDELDAASFLL